MLKVLGCCGKVVVGNWDWVWGLVGSLPFLPRLREGRTQPLCFLLSLMERMLPMGGFGAVRWNLGLCWRREGGVGGWWRR